MKKRLAIISVVLAALVIAGCSSAPKVYDPSVPLERSSTLILVGTTVMNFNDKFVGTTPSWMGHNSLGPKQMIIPAGTHTLSIYAEYPSSVGRILQIEYQPITFEFLPGHTCAIQRNSITSNDGVRITDVTELLKEFVPNSNAPDASSVEGKWKTDKDKSEYIFSGNQFVTLYNGKYQFRGFFSIQDNKVQVFSVVYYNKGKWDVYPMVGSYNLRFNGSTLARTTFSGDVLYTKVE